MNPGHLAVSFIILSGQLILNNYTNNNVSYFCVLEEMVTIPLTFNVFLGRSNFLVENHEDDIM